jgi:class 3 adenylate cyclase/tetratricopeptide (TPR) repeat protein
MICPVCGTANPDNARFCLQCGNALAGRATEGERRIVTMLFCDVVGSTAMAERLDPEAWTEIMNEVFELLIAPIHRYEGTLARLMGDAIFAFFGAPTAHEDDPVRAVRAGLEIVEAIRAHRAEQRRDLNVRVGINTGPVVVGEVGSDARVEYTAMGDAVNVAARMEQTAEPGTVQITGDTARLVGDWFELGPPTSVEVKGKGAPVTAHVVLGRGSRARAAVQPVPRSTPLVGRDLEMDTLRRAVDGSLEGRGRMVALIGEAGLGKSRLIEETRLYWGMRRPEPALVDSDIRRVWEIWRCVSYDRTRPYAQYRRIVSALAGIVDTDAPEVVREKLAGTVETGAASEWLEPHMRVWRSLFGVPEAGEEPLEGEAFREAIMDLVPRSTRYFASEPRMLVFEDLHWCDGASMDLLIETADAVGDLPSLLVFAFRPGEPVSERLRRWMENEHPDRSTQIELSPLSAEDSGALIDELVPEGASDAVRAELLERTEGNPLFLEEFVTAIRARGGEERDIPATLQALITARLDTLDDDARRTLQLASVIGRSFGEPVLGAVAGDGAALRGRLETLERAGLITESAEEGPERGFAFHHSLTQEAAYGTILLRERRALHLQVGDALERRYGARLEEYAPVLAHHFEEAGDDERTLRYAGLAGDHAARLYANTDAIEHYGRAIEAARRLDDHVLLSHLYPSRGLAMQLAGRYDEAEQNYEEMRARAEASGDLRAQLEAAMSLTTLLATPTPKFDVVEGRRAALETVRLAHELDETAAASKAWWNLMNANVYGGGDNQEAVDAGERSLALAREIGAREQIAFTLTDLWRPYTAAGDLSRAQRSLDEARALWQEFDNLPMLTENLTSSAALSRFAGNDDEALALAEEAGSIARSTENLWGQAYAAMHIFDVQLDRGLLGPAIDTMLESIDMGERVGFQAPLVVTRATLGVTYAYVGDQERARTTTRLALEVATERLPSAIPRVMGAIGEIHLLAGELDEAEAALDESTIELLPEPLRSEGSLQGPLVRGWVAQARGDHDDAVEGADSVLERSERAGVRTFIADAMLLKGHALVSAGRTREAEHVLGEAREIAAAVGHRRILWEILVQLARVDAEHRAALLEEAREIIRSMADTLDDDLRKRFLDRPDIRALLT